MPAQFLRQHALVLRGIEHAHGGESRGCRPADAGEAMDEQLARLAPVVDEVDDLRHMLAAWRLETLRLLDDIVEGEPEMAAGPDAELRMRALGAKAAEHMADPVLADETRHGMKRAHDDHAAPFIAIA